MIEANRRVSMLVGALVIGVGVTLGAILIFLGSATRLFSSTTHVRTCFADVTGLRSGASVLLAGVAVGSVSEVALGEPCGNSARVELAIDSAAIGRLSSEARANLVTMGLLGDRLVELVPGRGGAPLHGGELIASQVPPDATAVIAQAGEAFAVLTRIGRRLDDVLAHTDLTAALGDVVATAQSLHRVLDRAERGPGLLHLLIYDRKLEAQVRSVGPAAAELAASAGSVRKLMAQLDEAASNLTQIVAYVKSGQGTLGGVIYDPAIYEDLRTIVGGVRRNVILRTLGRFVLKHH